MFNKFKNIRLYNQNGSYTVEIGILIPLITMILIGFIYEAIFQYQRISVVKSVELASSIGAVLWDQHHKNPADNNIYWRLFSNFNVDEETGDQAQKIIFKTLKEKVERDISHLIIKPREVKIDARYASEYLQPGKIIVTARLVYNKPFGLWREKVLGRKSSEIACIAECSVVEPAENIRNIDFAFEVGSTLVKEAGLQDKLNDIGDGIKDSINKKITDIKNSILKRSSR